MSRDWEATAIVQKLRAEQRQREMMARHAPGRPRASKIFERAVTARLLPLLASYGPVNLTVDQAPFDVWVAGVRVEIKAANWVSMPGWPGRYQGTIRNGDYDVLLFVAVNGTDHHFVIPKVAIGRRTQVAITQYQVERYSGQWAAYLEAWDVLRLAVEAAPPHPVQLSFS